MTWSGPRMSLTWGPYWPPAVEDEKPIVEMAKLAKDAGIVTTEKAVERVKDIFGIENVEAFMQGLQAETEEKEKRDLDRMTKQAEIASKNAPPGKPPNGPPSKTANDNRK